MIIVSNCYIHLRRVKKLAIIQAFVVWTPKQYVVCIDHCSYHRKASSCEIKECCLLTLTNEAMNRRSIACCFPLTDMSSLSAVVEVNGALIYLNAK